MQFFTPEWLSTFQNVAELHFSHLLCSPHISALLRAYLPRRWKAVHTHQFRTRKVEKVLKEILYLGFRQRKRLHSFCERKTLTTQQLVVGASVLEPTNILRPCGDRYLPTYELLYFPTLTNLCANRIRGKKSSRKIAENSCLMDEAFYPSYPSRYKPWKGCMLSVGCCCFTCSSDLGSKANRPGQVLKSTPHT